MKKIIAISISLILLLTACARLLLEEPVFDNPADSSSYAYVGEDGNVAAVEGFAISSTEESIDLSWTAYPAPGATVKVLRKEGSLPADYADGTEVFSESGKPSGYSDTEMTQGIDYYYGIYASGNGQNSQMEVLPGRTLHYHLVYNVNGATEGTVPVDSTLYKEGDTVTVGDNTGSLTKSGSVFRGWNTAADGSGTHYQKDDTIIFASSDVVLYAEWKSVYPVSYNGNGSDGGSVPVDSTLYKEGDTVTVGDNTGSLTKSGSVFRGWNTAADGLGTHYQKDDTIPFASSDVVLYAEWKSAYPVSYNPNGATSGSVPVDSTLYKESSTVTVSDNTGSLTKSGSVFQGWNTAADGSGTSYAAAATFKMGTADVVLYAKWKDSDSLVVGDRGPAGGWIFYDDEADGTDNIAGFRYLEAAPADCSGTHVWGGYGTSVSGTGTAVGTGQANTTAIVAAYGSNEPYANKSDYAARLADDYSVNGFDDWFLPSKDELDLMYVNLKVNAVGGFQSGSYWSSSQYNSYYAWKQYFTNGSQFHTTAIIPTTFYVRCVRGF